MKIRLFGAICVVLLVVQSGIITARDIVGESELFTFDTRPIPVPLSNLAIVIAGLFIVVFLFMRYRLLRERTHV